MHLREWVIEVNKLSVSLQPADVFCVVCCIFNNESLCICFRAVHVLKDGDISYKYRIAIDLKSNHKIPFVSNCN